VKSDISIDDDDNNSNEKNRRQSRSNNGHHDKYHSSKRLQLIQILIGSLMVIIPGSLATLMQLPILFASIGPTAIIVVHEPHRRRAFPVALVLGHAVGTIAGLFALLVFGLYGAPSVITEGFTWQRVGATSVAIAITTSFSEGTRFYHPPAGATTLLISLGLVSTPIQIFSLAIGIGIITAITVVYRAFLLKYLDLPP
jgi:CBS-domain-containing membrane protein